MTPVSSPAGRRALGLALGRALRRLAPGGVGVVRVLDRHGFGTVEPGQLLVAGAGGPVAGAVFLGALDDVALPLARAARERPATRTGHVVGLDLGARTPAETAVSIVAEVIAVRSGRAGAALAGTDGRIGT